MSDAVDLRERVAVAAGTSDLSPEGGAVQIIAALGAAVMVRGQETPMGTAVVSMKSQFGARLERAKFAGDEKATRQAAILFALILSRKIGWLQRLRIDRQSPEVMAVARIVVAEWLFERCPQSCVDGMVMLGKLGGRNFKAVACRVCGGTGKRKVDAPTRAAMIGVTIEVYEQRWRRFIWLAQGLLRDCEADIVERLRRQNMRGNVRPVGVE